MVTTGPPPAPCIGAIGTAVGIAGRIGKSYPIPQYLSVVAPALIDCTGVVSLVVSLSRSKQVFQGAAREKDGTCQGACSCSRRDVSVGAAIPKCQYRGARTMLVASSSWPAPAPRDSELGLPLQID